MPLRIRTYTVPERRRGRQGEGKAGERGEGKENAFRGTILEQTLPTSVLTVRSELSMQILIQLILGGTQDSTFLPSSHMLLLVYTPDSEGDPTESKYKDSHLGSLCVVCPHHCARSYHWGLYLPSLFPSLSPVSSTNTLFIKLA